MNEPSSNLKITNLGPGINTPFDEIKPIPFRTAPGCTLCSKDRPDGSGGLDIYLSTKEGKHGPPRRISGPRSIPASTSRSTASPPTERRIVLYGAYEGHMGRGDNFYFEKPRMAGPASGHFRRRSTALTGFRRLLHRRRESVPLLLRPGRGARRKASTGGFRPQDQSLPRQLCREFRYLRLHQAGERLVRSDQP